MRLGDVLRGRTKDSSCMQEVKSEEANETVRQIPLTMIEANPFQPRTEFDQTATEELAQSLAEHGLIQPIVVRTCPGGYQLIAGERRVRAARQLGWETIPAVVRELDDAASAQVALIENLQREDLNYWEEAEAYQLLLQEFGMTQEGLADRIGRSQSAIANKLRLLRLGPRVRNCISREIMTERHCRALLKLKSEEDQLQAVKIIHEKELSVRETEELVKTILEKESGQAPRQRIVKVWRDARLLQNSVRQFVEEMRSGGAEVELKEVEGPDMLELTIRMRRKDGEGKAR